jgi:tRNA/tmRNA/rRNA uracil-C5-methylase (TrmA/RlmC/RlmD family)
LNPHLFDPRNIDALESENRKIWQNPEDILDKIETNPNFVAVDLGCGSDFFTIPLSRSVVKVYGVDVQKEMLDFHVAGRSDKPDID